ncbi:MAG TPA: lipoprotein-releasing ABC transporter permease subunit [Candidatus Angelobacter sp.]|nr:lipoprotein-releasing ABC transporter permease subunit [Candidatus Angelobacter sp.]
MFAPVERLIALRYLRARRKEGFISVIAGFSLLGICVGVATLIIVLSVMSGFRQEVLNRLLGVNGHLNLAAVGRNLDDFDDVAAEVAKVEGVAAVYPTVDGNVMATASHYAAGALVHAIRAEDLQKIRLIRIVNGSLAQFSGKSVVVIGSRLAERLHIKVGDTVTLIQPQNSCTVLGCIPRSKTYDVIAIFEVGMSIYDERIVYMPLEAGQLFFQARNAATALVINVDNPDNVLPIGRAIFDATGARFRIIDWQQQYAGYFAWLDVQRDVLALILALIMVVAALNVISGQVLLVRDKTREIAILRTMGVTRRAILRIFLMCGIGVGIVGTAAGVGLAVLFCDNIEAIRQWLQEVAHITLFPPDVYFLKELPARLSAGSLVGVVALSLGLSFLATSYAAWRAARLDPVEALRYE